MWRFYFATLWLFPISATTGDDGIAFFEKYIRPVLTQHCYECHSADSEELQGRLRLDTNEGIRKGGSSGAAIVPGDPDSSLLIESIRYDALEMPPDNQLTPEQIRHFETWVEIGAPDPRTIDGGVEEASSTDAGSHWSFVPISRPAVPQNRDSDWPTSSIDHFVLAQLKLAGLKPSPPI